jgi:hypothetical protein
VCVCFLGREWQSWSKDYCCGFGGRGERGMEGMSVLL